MTSIAAALRTKLHATRHIVPASTHSFSLACNAYRTLPTADITSGEVGTNKTPSLLFAHANGFHKELWEPVISRLGSPWNQGKSYAFDCRNHGDSAMLNKDVLEETFDWLTYTKDALSVVDALDLKKPVGVGHSFGASALIMAELARPGTFSAIVAIDPTMFPRSFKINAPLDDHPLASLALRRRDNWKSRAEAKKKMLEKQFFQVWDHQTLDIYLEYGMRDVLNKDGSTGITLKCPKFQEAITFASESDGIYDAFEGLSDIDIPVCIISGEISELNTPDLLAMKKERCKHGYSATVKGSGHLFPMEKPAETAHHISSFLDRLNLKS